MDLCILGWYGTETLGDRAILDGILRIFAHSFSLKKVYLGSLYPFFSERTLFEDYKLYSESVSEISIFDMKNPFELRKNIKKADYVIMGGGPLMDIPELYLITEGFLVAKKVGKKTAVLGCGYGPINTYEYKKLCNLLFSKSDLIVFRDYQSQKSVDDEYGLKYQSYVLDDPAIVSIINYRNKEIEKVKKNYIAVNFRDYPSKYYGKSAFSINHAVEMVKNILSIYNEIKLVPMHSFVIGGDDRDFLIRISDLINDNSVEVLYDPPSLCNLYEVFSSAWGCIGMRYHSVVMQTLLNGNNLIIDYTEKEKGKIASFIQMIDCTGFYKNRIIPINQEREIKPFSFKCLIDGLRFVPAEKDILNSFKVILG